MGEHMRFICWNDIIDIASRFLRSGRGPLLILGAALCFVGSDARAYDWPQFNGDPQHSGNNTLETSLGASNVSTLTLKYHAALPAVSDGVPVFLDGVATAGGVKELLFVMTKAGDLLALDARTGTSVWSAHYPNTVPIANCSGGVCITTSSPAIDPNRQYVYAYGLDGYVHKLQVGDGTEITTGGWPELSTLKPSVEKQSSALAVATVAGTSYLYSAISAHGGDGGDNQGHLTTINLTTGAQTVFNMVCSDQAVHFVLSATPDCTSVLAGTWARPGVIYDAGTGRIFASTGNGPFNAAANKWGDSIIALYPYGSGTGSKPLDAYTPTNQAALESGDVDLGSTAPAIIPVPPASNVQHLAVQGGKDAKLRLINLANMSGTGGAGSLGGEIGAIINVPQGGGVFSQPAVWINPSDSSTWVFVVNSSGSSGLRLTIDASGNPSLTTQWQKTSSGTSPLVANNVLYLAGSNNLVALNPTTGVQLWNTALIGSIHWQSPVVACGSVYVLDQSSQLSAFGLALTHSAVAGGNDQSTAVGGAFGSVLSVRVTDASNNPLVGTVVTFQLPASGASGTFSGGSTSATATTNASGIAVSPSVSANAIPGSYIATGTVSAGTCAAAFHLANTATKFVSSTPVRLLDTRAGHYTIDGMFNGIGARPAGSKLDLAVVNRGGVAAAGVGAVALNVTATNPTGNGFVTVWPTGATRPNSSNLNIASGQTIANLVIAKVGNNGNVSLFNSAGTDLIADLAGWFPTTSGLTPLTPSRLLDTRAGYSTVDGLYAGIGPVAAASELDVATLGRGGVPASGVGAVVLNVTATNPTAPGYMTVWPMGSARPYTSNLNFIAGETVPNLVVTPLGTNGKVAFYNSAGTTDLIGDVQGWFASTSELTAMVPFRLLDTRPGMPTGDGQFAGSGALNAAGQVDLIVLGRAGIPASGVSAVVLNVTAVNPSANGFLTAWPTGSLRPATSNLNFSPGETIPNLVIAAVGTNGKVSIYNNAGSTDVVADVVGWFVP
jgi:outer membrane protein assembly factor BamB